MASKRIAGITIEIGGDTTQLNKSLQGVDKQLAATKKSLRDVERLLKLNPGNTELVAQKQKYLSDAINQTKERLTQLKSVQKDSVSADQWDALQREIIETETDLKSLEDQYKQLDSTASSKTSNLGTQMQESGARISAAGDKIKAVGDKVGAAGKKLLPISSAFVGIGAASIAAAKEVDDGYDTIIQKTGATGKTLEGLQKQMDGVFGSLPIDAETAGIAIGEVNTRFGLVGDTLGDVSEQFIKFAEINGTDLNTAIDSVDSLMKKFGVDAKDAGLVLDTMTAAGQRTGVSMDTLYSQLEKNGATLKNMGLSLEDSVNLLADFEISGVDSAVALTGLRKAQQNATKSGKSLDQYLKQSVSSIKGAKTETKALEIATEIFGTKAAPEMAQAIREGRISLDNLNTSMSDYAGTVDSTYQETQDPWDQMKTMINQVKLAGTELADALIKTLQPIFEKVIQKVQEFTQWFKNLDDGQKDLIVRIGLVVAAVGPLLAVLGPIISGVGGVVKTVGTVTKTVGGVVGAISGGGGLVASLGGLAAAAGPFLLGGAIIAGVVAATVVIVKNWDKIKAGAKKLADSVGKAWEGFKKSCSQLGESIKKSWNTLATNTKQAWDRMKANISTTVTNMRTAITNGWNNFKSTIQTGWNNIKTATSTAWTNLKSAVSTGVNALKTSVSTGMNNIKTAMSTAWSAVKDGTSKAWSNIKSAASTGVNAVKGAVNTGMGLVKSAASGAWNSIKSSASSTFSAMKSNASTIISSIKSSFKTLTSGINLSNPFTSAVTVARNAMASIKRIFSGSISLPHIKVPRFKISGKFSLNPPQVPSISLRWYKKAYDNPMLFTRPTVLQTPYGLKGFGDGNGAEMVYGRDQLMKDIAKAKGGEITVNVYGSEGMSVNQLADAVQKRLVTIQRQRERAAYA